MSREQQAAELRERIQATDPGLLTLLDGLKATFGARVKHVRVGDYEVGDPNFGSDLVAYPPAPPRGHRTEKEARDWLRQEEAAHIAANAKRGGRSR